MRQITFGIAALALIGCGGDKDDTGTTTGTTMGTGSGTGSGTGASTGTGTGAATGTGTGTGSATAAASIRVVHAGPDAPAVDVYVAGSSTPLYTNVAWGDTTGRLDVPEGSYTVELRGAGADPMSAPAYSQSVSVMGGSVYTVVASGLLGSSEPAEEFRLLAFEDSWGAAGAGESLVRIVHASPTAPTVAVDVGDDGSPEIASLATWADTGAAGVPLPSGTELQVGILAGSARVTGFTTPALAEGETYYVIASGLLENLPREDAGFQLLAVDSAGTVGFVKQNPVVHALHAGPDAPAVDIFAGNAEVADNLAFGAISGSIQVPPGAYDLDFFVTSAGNARPAGNPAVSVTTPTLEAGERYLAIATGFLLGSPAFTVIPVAEGFDTADTNARIRVVHGSPDAPIVDVGTVSGGFVTAVADWSGVGFGDVSPAAGTSLPGGDYDLGIALTGLDTPVFTFSGVPVSNGDRLIVVASGSLTAGSFGLIGVDTNAWPWGAFLVQPD